MKARERDSFLVEAIFIIVIVYFSQVHLRIILSDRDLTYLDSHIVCKWKCQHCVALSSTLPSSLFVGAN